MSDVKNMNSNSILSIENLSFSYDEAKVLNNICFNVEEGSFISVLGPNGSGKTTLINIISKVLKGYQGKIIINGRDVKGLPSREVAKLVAVVPQYTDPGFNFSVGEIVTMGRYPYLSRFEGEKKEDLDVVQEVMEKTKIAEFYDKKFNELSGGEKQRVIIAQALVQDTPILLLDEPTAHLDINFQIELMDLFFKLNAIDGKTIVGVFHDINLALQYSRKAMLLKEGKIFSFGDIADTINRENIKRVFNSDIYVGKNPFTGKLYVSPLFTSSYDIDETSKKENKDVKVHVIGGGGAASPVLNLLYSYGYPVSCGVVNTLDTDLSTAETLGISYVSEAPFSPISFYSQNKNLEFIKSSDVVILPDVEFGHGNFSNLVSVKEALDFGKKVVVINARDIKKRDHTGGKASKLYEKIIAKGAVVVESIDQIIKTVK